MSLVIFASCHDSDTPYMTLATKTLVVEAEGGLFTVDLESNVFYRVNNDCQAEGSDSLGQLLILMRHKVRLLNLQSKFLKIHRLLLVLVQFVSLVMM